MKSARAIVSGIVQGVFYRESTKEKARGLGLSGWVRNLPDGSVEAHFEGDESSISAMIKWLNQGPPHARVSNVDVQWSDQIDLHEDFKIRY